MLEHTPSGRKYFWWAQKKKMSKFRVGEDKREELDWKTTTMKEKSRLDVVVQASNPSCG